MSLKHITSEHKYEMVGRLTQSKIYAILINAKTFQVYIYTFNNCLRICHIFSKTCEGGLESIPKEYFIVFQDEFSGGH